MNKWEKEVQSSLLDSEAAALQEIEKQYSRALNDIMDKVKLFDADIKMIDDAVLKGQKDGTLSKEQLDVMISVKQSKIYQKQYQEALQGQVSGILDKLHADNYNTIESHLKGTYTDAYVGTLYDIAQQGIPIIQPIDQPAVVKAVLTDSKISKGLYTALGVNTDSLKKKITQEISRGIASSLSYTEISRNLSNASGAPLSRTNTIVRTEGHRIQQASIHDAQQVAKDAGANVVKQWDAALDGRTRTTHRMLDGQIQELDDPFEVDGRKVDRPGEFGDPAEDCNCRCTCLTRARWALDEDELQALKERAKYFGLDKTKDFDDFKDKFLKASENVASQATTAQKNIDNFVPVETPTSQSLASKGVAYNKVELHDAPKSFDEIISTVAGGDKTSGSCASAALAYAGQKQGWNVLDFRGGGSMDFFASKMNKVNMFEDLGVTTIVSDKAKSALTNAKNILKQLEKGKEYYLSAGRHAAIVRRATKDIIDEVTGEVLKTVDNFQFLELQSGSQNGWMDFEQPNSWFYETIADTFKNRFGCRSSSQYFPTAYATDIGQLTGDDFRTILGYINTAEGEQRKGTGGNIK